jgi:hypothetical protein
MSLTFRRTLQLLWSIVSVAIVSACGALGSPSALPGANDDSPQTSSRTFHFTHAIQHFKVPTGVTHITISAYGAMGGGYSNPSDGNPGGLGAKVKATIPVTPGQVLVVNVGGKGTQNKDGAGGQGYNGGGTAGDSAFGGGGSSDVRTAQGRLADRLLVAAGGGSGDSGETSSCHGSSCSGSGSTELLYGGIGGIGGATTGGVGGTGADGGGGGTGASQTNGGAGGAGAGGKSVSFSSYRSCAAVDGSDGKLYNGGAGASDSCGPAGGGGGGGYYGGGGGGGGGTSFVEKSATGIHKTSGGAPPGNGEITIAW